MSNSNAPPPAPPSPPTKEVHDDDLIVNEDEIKIESALNALDRDLIKHCEAAIGAMDKAVANMPGEKPDEPAVRTKLRIARKQARDRCRDAAHILESIDTERRKAATQAIYG